jgi:hypothetical protein
MHPSPPRKVKSLHRPRPHHTAPIQLAVWLGAAARRPASRAPYAFPLRSAVPRSHTPPLRGMAGLGPLRAVATQAGHHAPHPGPRTVGLFHSVPAPSRHALALDRLAQNRFAADTVL